MGATEIIVIALVVGGRLLLPLLIPYFPVPALLSCLVLDSIDQTIFQQFPKIDLEGYQSYDKALDIYYLSIAYLSTLRNWTNMPALLMAAFLFYYRLVGDLLFELTQQRWLLFVFPNTFEYYFLFIVLIMTCWDQSRVSKHLVVWSTVFIWVVIKLPQEWWIHIAKLDFTDFMGAHPWVWVPIVIVAGGVITFTWWWVTHRAPPLDQRFTLRAAPLPPELMARELYRTARIKERVFDRALLQKIALVALVTVIFAQFLVSGASPLQVALSVTVFVILNAFVSQWLARRGRSWKSLAMEFAAMLVVNLAIGVGLSLFDRLVGIRKVDIPFAKTLFFLFLITILIAMFDRYHTVFTARRVMRSREDKAARTEVDKGGAPSGDEGGRAMPEPSGS